MHMLRILVTDLVTVSHDQHVTAMHSTTMHSIAGPKFLLCFLDLTGKGISMPYPLASLLRSRPLLRQSEAGCFT